MITRLRPRTKLAIVAPAAVLITTSSPIAAVASDESTIQFFVDPVNGDDSGDGLTTADAFRTIERARAAVDSVNDDMSEDIYVTFRGGEYELSTPVTLGPQDGGLNGHNVIYEAEVDPDSWTLTRRDPQVRGPVGEDILDGHEQEEIRIRRRIGVRPRIW